MLMHQRPLAKHHGGLWEFPGGKVESGEEPGAALVRESAEELGIGIDVDDLLPLTFASGPPVPGSDSPLVILLYTCRVWRGVPRALEGEGAAWCLPEEAARLDMPPLDRQMLAALSDGMVTGRRT